MLIRLRTAAWWLLTVLCAAAWVVPFFNADEGLGNVAIFFALAMYGPVGALVARRQPGNPLGWVYLAVGAMMGINAVSDPILTSYFETGEYPSRLQLVFLWLGTWTWLPMIMMPVTFTLLLFPNGLPSRRWRPVLWLAVASLA